jgi:hypothetical protein
LDSSQKALKSGIPGTPPPGPDAKATEWCRPVKRQALLPLEISILLSQRVLQHWPAMGSTRQPVYWLVALRQDQNPRAQACTRAIDRMFQERSVSASKRAALVEETIQRGSTSEELDA